MTKDLEILAKQFEVRSFYFDVRRKKRLPIVLLKQFFFLLNKGFSASVWVCQFAGYHSYLPVMLGRALGKKVVLILGGTDCVSFPSIEYGALRHQPMRYFTARSIQKAHLLLPVSETLVHYSYTYTNNDFPNQGYKAHIRSVKTPYKVIFNGYDADKWPLGTHREGRSFVTVGADLGTRFGKRLKGIDLILEIAPLLPDCRFYIIGGDKLNEKVPENVELLSFIPNKELHAFLGTKQFYLQLSLSEGFPNALCEAMLTGCIPIVSNVGEMPSIVGNTGFILERRDPQLLIDLIRKSMEAPKLPENSRNQISKNYPVQRRERELTETLSALFNER